MTEPKALKVGILGATGAVGEQMMIVLAERNFPVAELRLFGSARSAGTKLAFKGKEYEVEEASLERMKGLDLLLGAADNDVAKKFLPDAAKLGVTVVDNSSAFRLDPEVPLVIPEVNPEDVKWSKGLIANPNCATIIGLTAIAPLHRRAKVKRLIASTYQAVSGSGQKGISELETQVRQMFNLKEPEVNVYPHRIAFNCIPHIDVFLENDYTKEEMKMVNETKKIMEDYEMRITATTIRVPVYRSHSESVNIELEKEVDLGAMREALAKFPGVTVQDDPSKQEYPMPLYTSEKDDVYVGRLRRDESCEKSYNMWVVGDQIRKGAALNTLQIAETMIAVQIADYFMLKKADAQKSAFQWRNLAVWLVGFVIYRLLMQVDTPVGNTLPDMVITVVLCVVVEKIAGAVKSK